MAKVPPFHSINEVHKPADKRVYHDNDACPRVATFRSMSDALMKADTVIATGA